MRPFDLEEFKRKGKAVTRKGAKVEFLYYDERLGEYPLGVLIFNAESVHVRNSIRKSGKEFSELYESTYDLFMPDNEEKKEYVQYINIYQKNKNDLYHLIFDSENDAIYHNKKRVSEADCIKTAHKITIPLE